LDNPGPTIVSTTAKLKPVGLDHLNECVRQYVNLIVAERRGHFKCQLEAVFAELAKSAFFSQAFLHVQRISVGELLIRPSQ
jgi:hypothetical protein